jgi:hypothetical protein
VKIRNKDRLLGRSLSRVIKPDSPLLFVVSSQFSLMGKRSDILWEVCQNLLTSGRKNIHASHPHLRPDNDGKLFSFLIGSAEASL